MTVFGRFVDRWARRVGLDPDESRVLVLMGALSATLLAAYTFAKVLRDALFLAEYGALDLPFAYVGVALASVVFVWLETRIARRFTRVGATRFNQYAAIVLGLSACVAYPYFRHFTAAWFYLWSGSQMMMTIPHFWVLALDVWDTRRARIVFPVLAGCGLIGGLTAGAFAGWAMPLLVKRLGLMYVMCGLLIVAHVLTRLVEHHRLRRPTPIEVSPTTSRWEIFRRSPYMHVFVVALALSVIVSTLVDFQFKVYIQRAYPDPHALAQFLGRFYAGLNATALLFQFGVAGWLIQRFGLTASTGLQPMTVMLFAVWTVASAGLWTVLAMRWIQGVVFQTLGKSSVEIYYAAIRPIERRWIKPAIDTLVERWADAAVGVVLIVLLRAFHVPLVTIAFSTAFLAAVWLVTLVKLDRSYGRAFESMLSSRWVEPDPEADTYRTPAARRALLAALRGDEERRVVLALRMSAQARNREIVQAVRSCLRHPSPAVQVAAVEAMQAMRIPDPEHAIEGMLATPHAELRCAAVAYLLALDPRAATLARRWLDGDDDELVQCTVDALFDQPPVPGAITLEWIDARLRSESRADRLRAARALGALPHGEPGRLTAVLEDDDVEVRRMALQSAARRPSPRLLDLVVHALSVPDLRRESIAAVAAIGEAAVPQLSRLIDGEGSARVQSIATDALARIAGSKSARVLMKLAVSPDQWQRHLGFRGLSQIRMDTGQPVVSQRTAHRLFMRELNDYGVMIEPAKALENDPSPELRLLAESYRESAEMALERAIRALGCWYDPRPLFGAFERLKSREARAASPALEYLGHMLPRSVFRPVRKTFERGDPDAPVASSSQAISDWISLAWRTGDEWLRACAVRAARVTPGLEADAFADGDASHRLVRAEIEAWDAARGRPAAAAGAGGC